jgi:hypothetical protein
MRMIADPAATEFTGLCAMPSAARGMGLTIHDIHCVLLPCASVQQYKLTAESVDSVHTIICKYYENCALSLQKCIKITLMMTKRYFNINMEEE